MQNKKKIIFVFLFLTLAALPATAFAAWYNPLSWFDDIANGIINGLIYVVAFIPLFVTALAADIIGTLLKWALLIATGGISYTHSPAVEIGWPIVRDFANMFIVLGFVVIGIATTLRINDYQAKKLLPKLILAALLINFSLFICGIFIDASNIAMNFFFSKIGNAAFTFDNISNSFQMIGNIPSDSWTAFMPKVVSLMIFNFFEFFIFLLYFIVILARIIALWVLVILSPLAFVCAVFPFSNSLWQTWRKNFIQWCIIGVPMGLFLYIGSMMMSGVVKTPAPSFAPNEFFSADTIKTLTGFASFLLPGLFLVVGFLMSLQFSAIGASSIMNWANKNKGKAMGYGMGALSKTSGVLGKQANRFGEYLSGTNNKIGKGAGFVFKTAGKGATSFAEGQNRLNKTRSAFNRGLEAVGGAKMGSAAYEKSKEIDDSVKRMTAAVSEGKLDKVLEIAEGKGAGTNVKERAAAIGALLETKNFNLNKKEHIDGLKHFQDYGGNLSKYAEKNPMLAEHSLPAIKNTMTKHGVDETKAKEILRNEAFSNLTVKGLRENNTVNVHLLANVQPKKLEKASDEFSRKQIVLYKKFLDAGNPATGYAGSPEWQAAQAEDARLRATGLAEDREKADRIRNNIALIGSSPNFA